MQTIDAPEIVEDVDLNLYTNDKDEGDEKAHIVNPPLNTHLWQPGMSTQEMVDLARFIGAEVQALCGYIWVPKRNPEKYPACQECFEIAGNLMREAGE